MPALLGGCDMVVMNPTGDIAVQQRNLILLSIGLMLLIIVPVMLLRVEDRSDTFPTLTEARERVSRAVHHRMTEVTNLAAASSRELLRVRTAVQADLDAKARRARSFAASPALANVRHRLMDAMTSKSSRIVAIGEAAFARLQTQRQHLAKIEQERLGRTIDDKNQTLEGALPPAKATPPSKPVVRDAFAASREAAAARQRELCDIALASLKEKRAAVRRGANGLFTVDMAGLQHPEREALMRPSFAATLQDRLLAMFHEAVPTMAPGPLVVSGDQPIAPPIETTSENGGPVMPVSNEVGQPETWERTPPADAGPDLAPHDRPSASAEGNSTKATMPVSTGTLEKLGQMESEKRKQKQAVDLTRVAESTSAPDGEVGGASNTRLPGSHGPGDGGDDGLSDPRGGHGR